MIGRRILICAIVCLLALSMFNVFTSKTKRKLLVYPEEQVDLCPTEHRLVMMSKFCKRNSIVTFPNGTSIIEPYGAPNFNHSQLFVDLERNLLVSAKPSAAALFWRTLYASVTGQLPADEGITDLKMLRLLNVSSLSDFTNRKDKQRILHTCTRILVVQHPFTHLVHLHGKINERLRVREQPVISFREFAQFAIDKNRTIVQELKSMQSLSQACRLNYHMVLRVETLLEDMVPLVSMLYPDRDRELMRANLNAYLTREQLTDRNVGSLASFHREYDSLEVSEVKELLMNYRNDMKMLGYSLNATLHGMLATCQYNKLACC